MGDVNMMKKEEALQAVEKYCNHILQTSHSIEDTLLLFDDFTTAMHVWNICGIIDKETRHECVRFIIDVKQFYRDSIKRKRGY